MSAVQLNVLKEEINRLSEDFANPHTFSRQVLDLLIKYADLTYKPGVSVQQPLILPSLRPASLVIRQMESRLLNLAQQNPDSALSAAARLWQLEYVETRLLAAFLLGHIPLPPHTPVIALLDEWCHSGQERLFLQETISRASNQLCQQSPDIWLQTIRQWLSAGNNADITLGLIALNALIEHEKFTNLPSVYKVITDGLLYIPENNYPDLQTIITRLAGRSPVETTHFIRQLIAAHQNPQIHRLIRRILPSFPPQAQVSLRSALPTIRGSSQTK